MQNSLEVHFNLYHVISDISIFSAQQMASDTNILSFALPYYLTLINNSTAHIDAIGLINGMNTLAISLPSSLLFSIKVDVSRLYPELEKLSKNSEEWEVKRSELANLLRNGIYFATANCIISAILLANSKNILIAFRQNPALAQTAQTFLRKYIVLQPGFEYGLCFKQMISGFKEYKALNIGAFFIFSGVSLAGFLSYQNYWGDNGIIAGYGLSYYGFAASCGYYLFCHEKYQNLKLLHELVLHKKNANQYQSLWEQLTKAIPISLVTLCESGLLFSIATFAGQVGPETQAAYALISLLILVNFWITTNFAISSVVIMNKVKTNEHLMYPTALSGVLLSAFVASILPLIFSCKPEALMVLLNVHDPAANIIVKKIIRWMLMGSMLDGSYYAPMLHIRSQKDLVSVMQTRIPSTVLGIVLAFILVNYSNNASMGIAYAYFTAMASSLCLVAYKWHHAMQPYRQTYLSQKSIFSPSRAAIIPLTPHNDMKLNQPREIEISSSLMA